MLSIDAHPIPRHSSHALPSDSSPSIRHVTIHSEMQGPCRVSRHERNISFEVPTHDNHFAGQYKRQLSVTVHVLICRRGGSSWRITGARIQYPRYSVVGKIQDHMWMKLVAGIVVTNCRVISESLISVGVTKFLLISPSVRSHDQKGPTNGVDQCWTTLFDLSLVESGRGI